MGTLLWLWLHLHLLVLRVSLGSSSSSSSSFVLQGDEDHHQKVAASFVFGDSLVDSGNNNYLTSLSKANFAPNGIDFGRPSGRYTNGRTIVDFIAQQVGLKEFTPPYLDPTTRGKVVLHGVNYASGGGGILNHTGKLFIGRINMDAQLDNFANTKQDIVSMIGEAATADLMSTSIFSVTMGSNDFINNYLTPVVSAVEQNLIPPESFVDTLISRFKLQLTRLYTMGARKIVVANVGPIGCIPYQRDMNPSAGDDCPLFPNQLANSFNIKLKSLLYDLRNTLPGSMFVYADVYRIFGDILQNYTSYGFENGDTACCGTTGRFRGLIPCSPTTKICPDRTKFVFWDPYHPTDSANQIIAARIMNGNTDDVSPINVRQLANS